MFLERIVFVRIYRYNVMLIISRNLFNKRHVRCSQMMLDDKNVGTKSDIRQGKITGNFHFVRRPKAALCISPPFTLQCTPNPGGS